MNAFDEASKVEKRSLEILRPFIQQRAFNGQYVVTSKGPLARDLQKRVGDVLFNSDASTVYSVEIKAEQENKYGNFFLETWSNRSRFTPGWMVTLQADLLLYHFVEQDELYRIPFQKLKRWAWQSGGHGGIYKYPERCQSKYEQKNDTWGRCVPISDLTALLALAAPYRPLAEFENPTSTLANLQPEGEAA